MTFADLDNMVVLHGPQLTRLTDEEFFELCQHNPTLRLERNTDHEIIFMPPPAPSPATNQVKYMANYGSGTANTSSATPLNHRSALRCLTAPCARPMRPG